MLCLCLTTLLLPLAQDADLVITGGRIVTLDEERPEVRALAIRSGEVLQIGSVQEIEGLVGPGTQVVDLKGRLAIPGFIEGHAHFLAIGDAGQQLDLSAVSDWSEILALVGEAARTSQPGVLIRGRGWHQEKWDHTPEPNQGGLPLHEALSLLSPDNPVLLEHASGHGTFANARAMEMAGITGDTPDPPGGTIVRGEDGEATGFFRETASVLLGAARARARRADPRDLAMRAQAECLTKGVTSFQDAGSSIGDVEVFREMADSGDLSIRLWVMLDGSERAIGPHLESLRVVDHPSETLTVRAIKRSLDGALGSHGAWLLSPYADKPTSVGLNTLDLATLSSTAALALKYDYQLCVHAIGDRANREVFDAYERAWAEGDVNGAQLRWRIEHAQHLNPEDVGRFADLGVIASMQGVHCTSDAPWVPDRLGEDRAASGSYLWKSLVTSGAVLINGTDAPVEDVNPIASFHSTVTRRLPDGTTFMPEQRLSRLEALRSYTLAAAFAAFEEGRKGSLSPGKLGDLVVLSRDILDCPEDEILGAQIDLTIVGGQILYRR